MRDEQSSEVQRPTARIFAGFPALSARLRFFADRNLTILLLVSRDRPVTTEPGSALKANRKTVSSGTGVRMIRLRWGAGGCIHRWWGASPCTLRGLDGDVIRVRAHSISTSGTAGRELAYLIQGPGPDHAAMPQYCSYYVKNGEVLAAEARSVKDIRIEIMDGCGRRVFSLEIEDVLDDSTQPDCGDYCRLESQSPGRPRH